MSEENQTDTEPSTEDICTWFNAWLREPIGERDRVIIDGVRHCLTHPADARRAVMRKKYGWNEENWPQEMRESNERRNGTV